MHFGDNFLKSLRIFYCRVFGTRCGYLSWLEGTKVFTERGFKLLVRLVGEHNSTFVRERNFFQYSEARFFLGRGGLKKRGGDRAPVYLFIFNI